MKTVLLVTASIFISVFASAQTGSITPAPLQPNLSSELLTALDQPKAMLIGTSGLGNVYAMAPDNMPCLVPFIKDVAAMPVLNTPLLNFNMPNAYPDQHLLSTDPVVKNLLQLNKPQKKVSKNLMLDLIRKK